MNRSAYVPAALSAAILLLLGTADPGVAQERDFPDVREHRSGFWLSGGLGGGLDEDGEGGGAGYLRLGGTPDARVAVGFDVVSYTRDAGGATLTLGNATGAVYFYPEVDRGLFLKAGLGLAVSELEDEQGDVTVTLEDEGLGATLGAGWDVQLGGGNLYLTPNLDLMLREIDTGPASVFLLTVGIGFR